MVTVVTRQTKRRCHKASEAASVTKSDTQSIDKDSSLTTWREVDVAHELPQIGTVSKTQTYKHTFLLLMNTTI